MGDNNRTENRTSFVPGDDLEWLAFAVRDVD